MTRDEAIEEITRRLIAFYNPERVYLFGSAARGDWGPDDDLDFCVVLPDDAPEQLIRGGSVYKTVRGIGYPKDIVPWRKADFDARATRDFTSLPAEIIREGRLLYDARPVPAQ